MCINIFSFLFHYKVKKSSLSTSVPASSVARNCTTITVTDQGSQVSSPSRKNKLAHTIGKLHLREIKIYQSCGTLENCYRRPPGLGGPRLWHHIEGIRAGPPPAQAGRLLGQVRASRRSGVSTQVGCCSTVRKREKHQRNNIQCRRCRLIAACLLGVVPVYTA